MFENLSSIHETGGYWGSPLHKARHKEQTRVEEEKAILGALAVMLEVLAQTNNL